MRTGSQTNFARVCGSWAERLLLAGESPGGASALHRLSAAREHLLHTPFVRCPSLKAFPISGIPGLHCRGFFTGRAMLPPSGDNRLTCGFPDVPAALPPSPPPPSAFRAVHRFRSAVNSLGSVGLTLVPWVCRFLPRVTGDRVKPAGNLGLCHRRDPHSLQNQCNKSSSSLLGMVIENHTTNTSDPERLDGRWGKRVTVTLDLCSVSQTVWAPTHDNVLCCMRLYPIKRGCLHPKRSLVPASF